MSKKRYTRSISITVISFILMLSFSSLFLVETVKSADPGWWTDTDYHHCNRILFNADDYISSEITNFVMRVSIVDDDDLYANMSDNTDGDELLFASGYGAGANQTQLSHEIEWWDTTGNDVSAEIWVNVTTVSSTADTKIWMYYGKSVGSSNENIVDTWDNGYVGVWHLGDIAGGTVYDSLGVHDSTYIDSLTDDSTGKIGHGGTFAEGYAKLTYSSALAFSIGDDFTITAWVKTTDDSNNQRIFTCGDESSASYYMTEIRDAGGGGDEDHLILIKTSTSASAHSSGSGDGTMIDDGYWHHVTGVYKQASGVDMFSYLNGTLDASHDGDLTGSLTGHDVAYIGRAYNSDLAKYKFNGDMDEVRVSEVARSVDWIELEFHTSNITSGFLTIGSPVEYVVTGVPSLTTRPGFSFDLDGGGFTSGGTNLDDNNASITHKGVQYGTSPTPNIYSASSGSGEGDYTTDLSGFNENSLYYYRGYANNSEGTGYGSTLNNYTYAIPPTDPQLDVADYGETWILWRLVDVDYNPKAGQTDGYFDIVTNPGGGSSGYSTSDDASYYYFNDTGLTADSTYGMKARYHNFNDTPTTYNNEVTQKTSVPNANPVINTSTIFPSNESTGVDLAPTFSVYISDADDATQNMNITWYYGFNQGGAEPSLSKDAGNPHTELYGGDTTSPTIVKDNGIFHIFYMDDITPREVHHAWTDNLEDDTWNNDATDPVLSCDPTSIYHVEILCDTQGNALNVSGYYWMFYANYSTGTVSHDHCEIAVARATTLNSTWVKYDSGNFVLEKGSGGSWDDEGVGGFGISVFLDDDGMYKMIYSGFDGSDREIGLANSSDLINWTKFSGNPILEQQVSGFGSDRVIYPDVVKKDSLYLMWLTGKEGEGGEEMGRAWSTDLENWTLDSENPLFVHTVGASWEDTDVSDANLLINDNKTYMIYEGEGGTEQQTGMAWADDFFDNITYWRIFNTTTGGGSGVSNGTYTATNSSWVDSYNVTYYWRVNVSDGNGGYADEIFHFETGNNSAPVLSGNDCVPDSGVVDHTVFYFNVTWTDIDDDNPTDSGAYLKVNITKTGWYSNQTMIWISGANSTGALYSYNTQLSATGEYTYYMWAYDGKGGYDDVFDSEPLVNVQSLSFTIVKSSPSSDQFDYKTWTLTLIGVGLTTEYNVSEDNQTANNPAMNITNTGNVPLNFTIYWVATPGAGIDMKWGETFASPPDPGVADVGVGVGQETQFITNLVPEDFKEIFLWMDFVTVGAGSGNQDVTITSYIYQP